VAGTAASLLSAAGTGRRRCSWRFGGIGSLASSSHEHMRSRAQQARQGTTRRRQDVFGPGVVFGGDPVHLIDVPECADPLAGLERGAQGRRSGCSADFLCRWLVPAIRFS
jgi:hypothetical protein